MVKKINDTPEGYLTAMCGIKKEQLVNLHLGKPIPWYQIVNEKLEPVFALNVHRLAAEDTLSLRFTNKWNLPVMSAGEPIVFVFVGITDGEYTYMDMRPLFPGTENPIKQIYNYEHKDWLIGAFEVTPSGFGLDYLMIRKEDKDVFVEIYDKATGEYCKSEYSSGELIQLLEDRAAKEKEVQRRYYAQVADKSELILTPEITEMLLPHAQSHWSYISDMDEYLSLLGIKNKAQLDNLHLGKPIPKYSIVNGNLTFTGYWEVPVMSDVEPLFRMSVKLEEGGQYTYAGGGGATMAGAIQNYEHKDLVVGILGIPGGGKYLIIRKDNTNIFVKSHNSETGEVYIEYSLSDIINLLKK